MTVELTPAYIATIGPDHTVALPEEAPVGAMVAVVIMPTGPSEADGAARSARFAVTLAAIRAVSAEETLPAKLSDADLDALIEQARKAPPA